MSSRSSALSRAHSSIRRRVTGPLVLLLVVAGLVLLPAGAASAVYPAFTCSSNAVYALAGDGVVRKVTSTSGASSDNADFGKGTWNALALARAGSEIWGFDRDDNRVRVARSDHSGDTWKMPANSLAGGVVAGAINPRTGIYYYASSGSTWTVFAFNTLTETALGQVATISGTGLGGNGDFAFDATGTLFVVSNNGSTGAGTLARVDGSLPTTSGSTALSTSVLTGTPGGSGQYHSMAFDSSGLIVIGTSTPRLIRVNPTTGATVDSSPMGYAFVDLASCASPSTAQAQVDLPQGRHTPGDQFTVTITGHGLSSGNSGTTAGTDSGVQGDAAEKAGPSVVLPGQGYTLTQTAAGSTDLAHYATTWRCVDGNGATLASGSGQTGTFTVPSTAGSSVTCTVTNTPLRPALELDKTASAVAPGSNGQPDPGDTITYGFTVTNTGNVVLDPVRVHDPRLSGARPNITCPNGPLAVGASVTCTSRSYPLTQVDVDAGSVVNTATATGTGSNGVVVTDSDSTTTPVAAFPALVLDKTAGAILDEDGNGHDAGDTIAYGFTVTNTGNVTLDPVSVQDPRLGGASPHVTCPPGALAPGASRACTGRDYALTRADVDAGSVDNTATATGTSPQGVEVTATDTTSTAVTGAAALELDKSVSAIDDLDGNGADAGDRVTYGFTLTNTGSVTLDPVAVHDPLLGGASPNVTCPTGPLAAGGSRSCTSAVYTLTQADVDAGRRENTATATGTAPGGAKVTSSDTTTTTIQALPAVQLTKGAGPVQDLDGNGTDAGDRVTFTFAVRNTGTVVLQPVTVHDPLLGGASPNVSCPAGPLAPGATATCSSAAYTLTQGDVDAGEVTNTATVTGTAPDGVQVTDPDSVTVPLTGTPGLELTKSASSIDDVDGNGPDAGDRLTYSFTVRNTGGASLQTVSVHDPLFADPAVGCGTGPLAPGASRTCAERTYELTVPDLDRGVVDNTATATGTTPGGATVSDSDSTSTPVAAAPVDLVVGKSVDQSQPYAGQSVTYTLTVRNDGGGTATGVTLTDRLPAGVTFVSVDAPCTEASGTVTCGWDSLAGGEERSARVVVTVDPIPTGGPDHDHWLDVQKAEVHLDLEPGQERTLSVTCPTGYAVTDGSGRVDHVDQGTGTLGSVGVRESRAVSDDTWQVTARNGATGRAQAKVFSVCVKRSTEVVDGHAHTVGLGGPSSLVTQDVDLSSGSATTTLQCAPGTLPAQPGYVLDGVVTALTSYPSGDGGWTFSLASGPGGATGGEVSVRCVDQQLGEAAGHRHTLDLQQVTRTVTVAPGQVLEVTLECPVRAKGVVAGWDLDPGLVNLGNDPRPIVRVLKLLNPTDAPLSADLWLGCLGTRTRVADPTPTITNTVTAATTSTEPRTGDNTASASFTVRAGAAPAVPSSPRVAVSGRTVTAPVACEAVADCGGTATLVALKTQKVGRTTVRKGAVLAKGRYAVGAEDRGRVVLKATGTGRKVLARIGKAQLRLGGEKRTVSLR